MAGFKCHVVRRRPDSRRYTPAPFGSSSFRLLPSRRLTADSCAQMWNVDPANDQRRTALDDAPTPTELKVHDPDSRVAVWVAVQHRATPCREDRLGTLVQAEPIRTAATLAANAVGLTALHEVSPRPLGPGQPKTVGPLAGH